MARRRLPPLSALRAFEVASRQLSFKRTADELCITSTAVSHRIRSLEDWLGVKLFNRLTRSIELTKEGEAYAPRVRAGFELLADASDDLRRSSEGGELVVSTTMSFASNWLAPRLPGFYESHDELAIRIEGSDAAADFRRTNIDVAIRYGEGDYDDLHFEMLFADIVTPVCSPGVAAGIRTPSDLLRAPRVDYRWSGHAACDPSWAKWFALHDIVDPVDHPLPTFSEEHLVLSQALAGRGVALVGIVAAADAILDGRLVRPFPTGLENRTYYFVSLPDQISRRKIQSFRDWLKDEAVCFEQQLVEDARLRFERVGPAEAR